MIRIKQIFSSIVGIFAVVGVLYLIGFIGKFTDVIAEFFTWYFTYKYCDSGLNNFFSLIVKIIVWIVPFLIANLFSFSNKKNQKKVSNFIATLVGMLLTVLFKFVQDYLWWILGILCAATIITIIIVIVKNNNNKIKQTKVWYEEEKQN